MKAQPEAKEVALPTTPLDDQKTAEVPVNVNAEDTATGEVAEGQPVAKEGAEGQVDGKKLKTRQDRVLAVFSLLLV